jgi:septum formation protein
MLYLASRSPQRAMLLQRAQVAFQVVDGASGEEAIKRLPPQVLALERARAKAQGVRLRPEQFADGQAVIVGADTVVALGQTVFGKPANRADAERMLTQLQGTSHSVFTGHACVRLGADGAVLAEAARIAMARITLRPMTSEEIRAYVASGESDGRAGGYAIQETGDRFVADLQGDWDTVVGLNVAMTLRLYRECLDEGIGSKGP